MAANVLPTRMELNNLRGKMGGAKKGHDLLKRKSDALTMKFRSLLHEIRETKLKVGELAKAALFAYTQVKYVAGDISPMVTQQVSNMPQLLFMTIDNVAGVRVPEFSRMASSGTQTLVGLARGGQQIAQARQSFNELFDEAVHLAALQSQFQVIDEVLRITNRRVNAMEYVLIPRYEAQIAFVEFGLEEQEREEFFRLKKVQARRKELQEMEEQTRLARLGEGAGATTKAKDILEDDSSSSEVLF